MTDDELTALGLCDESDPHFAARADFMRGLLDLGATVDEIVAAAELGESHLHALRFEFLLMPPVYRDVEEAAAASGATVEELRDWWHTIGFRDPTQPGCRFSAGEVELVQAFKSVSSLGGGSAAAMLDMLRLEGALSRQIAAGGVEALEVMLPDGLRVRSITSGEMTSFDKFAVDILSEGINAIVGTMIRRFFLEAVASITEVELSEAGAPEMVVTAMFVDIVDFTSLSRRVDAAELGAILSAFESASHSAAVDHRGHVVKMLGDGAMLSFTDPCQAVAAARELVAYRPELPPCRAGIASGRVLSRQGDLFGAAVNLAARLAGVVGPGEIAVDTPPDGVGAQALDPVVLTGYDVAVTPYRVLG